MNMGEMWLLYFDKVYRCKTWEMIWPTLCVEVGRDYWKNGIERE